MVDSGGCPPLSLSFSLSLNFLPTSCQPHMVAQAFSRRGRCSAESEGIAGASFIDMRVDRDVVVMVLAMVAPGWLPSFQTLVSNSNSSPSSSSSSHGRTHVRTHALTATRPPPLATQPSSSGQHILPKWVLERRRARAATWCIFVVCTRAEVPCCF